MEKDQYEIMRRLEDSFWWYVGMRRIVSALLPPPVPGGASWRILDAGCGTGATLDFLAPRGAVVGVDIAAEALSRCHERGHRLVSRGSIEQLPFPGASFDLVTCFDVIYHRAVSDDVAALREFHRVLRPGGRVLVRAPAYDWLRGVHDAAVHTRHRYTAGELRLKLNQAGFRVVRLTHANCLLLPMAVAKRLLEGWGAAFPPDLEQPHPLLNRLLTALLSLEARAVRRADLPCGLSVIGVGVK